MCRWSGGGSVGSGRGDGGRLFGGVLALGAGQAVVVAERGARVLVPEESALLQDRHDLRGEVVEELRVERRHHVEAFARSVLEPALHRVRDLYRGAVEDVVSPAAGEAVQELAQ